MYKYDLFLAHSSEDKPLVRELAKDLESVGFHVWLDEEEIAVGDSIVGKISDGLGASRFLGVCISRKLKGSNWVRAEYASVLHGEFRTGKTRVLPLLIDDFDEADIPPLLLDKRWCDLRGRKEYHRLLERLGKPQSPNCDPSSDNGSTQEDGSRELTRVQDLAEYRWEGTELSSVVQLWFPYPVARAYFHFLQSDDTTDSGRLAWRMLDSLAQLLCAYLLAELYAQDEARWEDFSSGERPSPDLMEKLGQKLSEKSKSTLFIPELRDWIRLPDGTAGREFSMFRQLWQSGGREGIDSESSWNICLEQILASLDWLAKYYLVSVGPAASSRDEVLSWKYRFLIGSIEGFLEQPFSTREPSHLGEATRCFLVAPGGRRLLSLYSLVSYRPEEGLSLWFEKESAQEQIDSPTEGSGPASAQFRPGTSSHCPAVLESTLQFPGQILEFNECPFEKLPATPAWLTHGPRDVPCESCVGTYDHYERELRQLEVELVKLPRETQSLDDSSLLTLDQVARMLHGLVTNGDMTARCRQRLEAIFLWWQSYVDSMDSGRLPPSIGHLFNERKLMITEALLGEGLAGFWDGELLLSAGLADDPGPSRYSLGRTPGSDELAEMLMGGDSLEQDEALHFLLRGDAAACVTKVEGVLAWTSARELSEVLWQRAPRIWLHNRRAFWALVCHLLPAAEDVWRPRIRNLRHIFSGALRGKKAEALVQGLEATDEMVLCQFLALHPLAPCRSVGLEKLPLEGMWDLVVAPTTRLSILHDIVEICCREAPDPYIKALFLLCWQRMVDAETALDLASAYETMMHFYRRPLFLEDSYFRAILNLHKTLSASAQKETATRVLDQRYGQRFVDFARQHPVRDNEVTHMRHVPLPIQRLLAHRGYFPEAFICNIRDVIALETVPHVCVRDDAFRFVRMKRINHAALEQLGKDKRLMREHKNRVAYCHNPKAKPFFVRQFVPYLRRHELRNLVEDRGAGTYSREVAQRHLSRSTAGD